MKKIKKAKVDFTAAFLPHTRRQVFFDCIKQRFDVIIKLGLLLLASALPLMVVGWMGDLAYYNLQDSGESLEAVVALAHIISLIKIPFYILLGICLAGCARVIRPLIWSEPIFFWQDFILGLKQNGLRYSLVFAITAVLRFINGYIETTVALDFAFLPGIIFFILLIPIALYMLSQAAIYDCTIGKSAKYGLMLYMRTAPGVWAFLALFIVWNLIMGIPVLLIRIIIDVLGALFLLPMFSVAWMLFSCQTFDKFINMNSYPELVGKGIFSAEDDFDDKMIFSEELIIPENYRSGKSEPKD